MEIFNYERIKPSMFHDTETVAFKSELKDKLMTIMNSYATDLDKPKAKVKVYAIDTKTKGKAVIYCEGYRETLVNAFLYIAEKSYNEAPIKIEKVGKNYKVLIEMEEDDFKPIPFKSHRKYTFLSPDLLVDGKS